MPPQPPARSICTVDSASAAAGGSAAGTAINTQMQRSRLAPNRLISTFL
jgi:hypothetical protein